jgi:hypothetical protein
MDRDQCGAMTGIAGCCARAVSGQMTYRIFRTKIIKQLGITPQ